MARLSGIISSRDGNLIFNGVNTISLAKRYGTPLLVTSEIRLIENYTRLASSFGKFYDKFRINYAVKANPNPNILSILRKIGAGADAASTGEIDIGLKAGVPEEKVIFSPNNAALSDFKYAIDKRIAVNFDDIGQYEIAGRYRNPELVSFRLNPGFGRGAFPGIVTAGPDAKFGIPAEQIMKCYALAKRSGVERFGIHAMGGSNVLDPRYFAAVTSRITEIAGQIADKLDIEFEFIDIGGGLGVPYKEQDHELDITKTARLVAETFKERCKEFGLGRPWLTMEPGRYLVADTTILLGTVNNVKNYSRAFIGTDIGMNVLLRPALYGAYHRILVASKMNMPNRIKGTVVGQICENTDVIAKDRSLPVVNVGDIVAVLNAGAYVYSMSNQYNSIPRPMEVLITRRKKEVVIRRRETKEDVLRTVVFHK